MAICEVTAFVAGQAATTTVVVCDVYFSCGLENN
mgnify:CR=1 FL=1